MASCSASSSVACQYTAWTAWANVNSCTALAQSTGPNYTVGTATQCQSSGFAGSSDSLADVAMYYYEHDLRTTALNNCTATVNGNPIDVCLNNVSPSGADNVTWQHMTTYTLGMGVSGTLRYRPDYLTAATGTYRDLIQGTTDWPVPVANTETAVDDLWHAAVDGRGRYFSAGDPVSLAASLSSALQSIDAQVASGSGAAASTLQPVAGDNTVFIAKYKSVFWTGDLVARDIDPVTGVIAPPRWSAAQKLQAKVDAGTPRTLYYGKRNAGTNTGAFRPFTYAQLTADGLNGYFDSACSKTVALSQCATLIANQTTANAAYAAGVTPATQAAKDAADAALAAANSGANMVDYLRGGSNSVYRTRSTGDVDIGGGILGDIIGGAPVYVRKPSFNYVENNYAGFVAAIDATNPSPPVTVPATLPGRRGVVYAGSNDGMLHAFDGVSGEELWAYIPSMVMDRMYRLADKDYANRHEYFVNAAPVIGDIYIAPVAPATVGTWKTIIVGGLGAGGRGYYALDITNPDSPSLLWEFSNDALGGNSNLGQSFGNPVITKRADGTWVVAFTSGYNNVSYIGDLTPGDGADRRRRQRPPVPHQCQHRPAPARHSHLYGGRGAGRHGHDAERAEQAQRLGRLGHRQHRQALLRRRPARQPVALRHRQPGGADQRRPAAGVLRRRGRAAADHDAALAGPGQLRRQPVRGGLCRHRQVPRYHRPGQHRAAIGLCDQGSADQFTAG